MVQKVYQSYTVIPECWDFDTCASHQYQALPPGYEANTPTPDYYHLLCYWGVGGLVVKVHVQSMEVRLGRIRVD